MKAAISLISRFWKLPSKNNSYDVEVECRSGIYAGKRWWEATILHGTKIEWGCGDTQSDAMSDAMERFADSKGGKKCARAKQSRK